MGSISGWLDMAKWTCFGFYFVLEDLTIVRYAPFSFLLTAITTTTY